MSQSNKKSATRLRAWLQKLSKEESWCILITADPDALGAAMALKRLLSHKVLDVTIARTNEITRPDNLAMIRYLRIPTVPWHADMQTQFQRFALVDSQPQHNPAFAGIPFSLIIDHHPIPEQGPPEGEYVDIRSECGATCSMLGRYLNDLGIRPGRLLATAMLYGIRTDTAAFERSGGALDLEAYQWLSKHAEHALLRRIIRSEYLLEWLPLFGRAFRSLHHFLKGAHAHVGDVNSPDLLVAIADFFTRVHGLKWVAVSGVYNATVVVIFRGDGSRDVGKMASLSFGNVGSAGGHRVMARAEFPLKTVGETKAADYVRNALENRRKKCNNTIIA